MRRKNWLLMLALCLTMSLCMSTAIYAEQNTDIQAVAVDVDKLTDEQLHDLVFSDTYQEIASEGVRAECNTIEAPTVFAEMEEPILQDCAAINLLTHQVTVGGVTIKEYTAIAAADYSYDDSQSNQETDNLMTVYARVNYRVTIAEGVDPRVQLLNTQHRVVTASSPIVNLLLKNNVARVLDIGTMENSRTYTYPGGSWYTLPTPTTKTFVADWNTRLGALTLADRGTVAQSTSVELIVDQYD